MRDYRVDHWDLIKLDCEGSEFGILENWPGPVARQISVEFHDWTGPWAERAAGDYYERLFAGPLKDYEVVQHELSKQGEGIGHWDSLLRLRA
jgi:methyltransferase family protein